MNNQQLSLQQILLLQQLLHDQMSGPRIVMNISPLQLLALSGAGAIAGYTVPTFLKYLYLNEALVGNSSRALRTARLFRSLAVPGALVGSIVTPILVAKLAKRMAGIDEMTPEERMMVLIQQYQQLLQQQDKEGLLQLQQQLRTF